MVASNRLHQGLVLDMSPLEMVKIKELDPIWVTRDEGTDLQHLRAIIRSSYLFGDSGVVLCATNSTLVSDVVSKASAGSLELMELRYCNNMMHFVVSPAENSWQVLSGSVCSKAIPLNGIPTGQPNLLVLGSEGTGLRPLVERSCTNFFTLEDKGVLIGRGIDAIPMLRVCAYDQSTSIFTCRSMPKPPWFPYQHRHGQSIGTITCRPMRKPPWLHNSTLRTR